MCQTVKCKGCLKPKQSCTLVNGLCHSCRQPKKPQNIETNPILVPKTHLPNVTIPVRKFNITTPNRITDNVYHTV